MRKGSIDLKNITLGNIDIKERRVIIEVNNVGPKKEVKCFDYNDSTD